MGYFSDFFFVFEAIEQFDYTNRILIAKNFLRIFIVYRGNCCGEMFAYFILFLQLFKQMKKIKSNSDERYNKCTI